MKRRHLTFLAIGLALVVPTIVIAAELIEYPILRIESSINRYPEISGFAVVNPKKAIAKVFLYSTVAGETTPDATRALLNTAKGDYTITISGMKDAGPLKFRATSDSDMGDLGASELPKIDEHQFVEMVTAGNAVTASFGISASWVFSNSLEVAEVTVTVNDNDVVIRHGVDRR